MPLRAISAWAGAGCPLSSPPSRAVVSSTLRIPLHCTRGLISGVSWRSASAKPPCYHDGATLRMDRRAMARASGAVLDDAQTIEGGPLEIVQAGDILDRESGLRRRRFE